MPSDDKLFLELFEPAKEEIYRIAYLYLKNEEDAKDVLQETAYRCFKSFGRLRKREYFKTWAIKTAINCSIDILKQRSRVLPLDETVPLESLASPSSEHETEDRLLLEKLMDKLDGREKAAVILKYLYGLKLREIAKALNLPLGTVKSILYRAMNKLEKESDLL